MLADCEGPMSMSIEREPGDEISPGTVREFVHRMIRVKGSRAHAAYQSAMSTIVALNILTIMLATVDSFRSAHYAWTHRFEVFTSAVFFMEFVLGIWSAVEGGPEQSDYRTRAKYLVTSLTIVDFIGFMPFLLRTLTPIDIRYVRAIRLLRLLRLLYHDACSRPLQLMWRVLRNRRSDMGVAGFLVFLLLVISSSTMYFIEHDAQPNAFSSIPESLWWGVMTLTTIGYGDIVPTTTAGRIVTAFIGLLGVGIVALPASLFTAGLIEELQATRKRRPCPHCGKALHDEPEPPGA